VLVLVLVLVLVGREGHPWSCDDQKNQPSFV
jgi:hypothetical protein